MLRANGLLHILKSTTASESLILEVDIGVLVINLHFVEALLAKPLGMNDEATLGVGIVMILIVHHVNANVIHAAESRHPHDREGMCHWRL